MTTMHHFIVDADPADGMWIKDTMNYLGEVDAAEHYAKRDTDAVHYDQADPEAYSIFAEVAGFDIGKKNVAITMVYSK